MIAPLLACIPPLLIVAGVCWHGYASRFGKTTILLLLAATGLYYSHFYRTNWQDFSIDSTAHMDYVEFLVKHHRMPIPADNAGAAMRHPPVFYVASAGLYEAAQAAGLNPQAFSRHIAMACYVVFILIGTHMLRLWLTPDTLPYIAALLLLLFWPVGATMGARISCDIPLYAAMAGVLYALMRWMKDPAPERLCAAFIWSGLAIMSKNAGTIMLGMACVALLKSAWDNRRNLRAVLRIDLTLSILFAILCNMKSAEHGWVLKHSEIYHGYHWDYLLTLLGSFNFFLLIYDTSLGLSQESFWNIWLHSLPFGASFMSWNAPDVMLAGNVIWLALLAYILGGLLQARKALLPAEKQMLVLFAAYTGIMIAAACYFLLISTNLNYADARYAYPAMLGVVLAHGLAMQHHKQAGRMGAYRIGMALSIAFTCITLGLFSSLYLA